MAVPWAYHCANSLNIKIVCQDFNGHTVCHTEQHATRLAVHRDVCVEGDDCPVFGCKCERARKTFGLRQSRGSGKVQGSLEKVNLTNMSNASRKDGKGIKNPK